MVDNFELISTLLTFNNPQEFYFLQIIQRKKDFKEESDQIKYYGSNNNNRTVKTYYIYSLEQLNKLKPEIIALCNLFNARAGINLNKRDNRLVSLEMLELLARDIRVGNYEAASSIYNSICGSVKGIDKNWILDIDIDTPDRKMLIDCIKVDLQAIEPFDRYDKIIAQIPTKNGVHLITSPFNTEKFNKIYKDIAIHRNNPTILYCI